MRLLAILAASVALAGGCDGSGPAAPSGSPTAPGSAPAEGASASTPANRPLAERARALRQVVREQPTSGAAHRDLALAYFAMGEDAAGKAALFRAMALAPDDPATVAAIAEHTPRMAPFSVEQADAARARLEAQDGAAVAAAAPAAAPALAAAAAAPAPAATPAARPAAAGAGPAPGRYKCYASINGSTQYVFVDFDITGPDRYRDKQGTDGSFTLDGKRIAFQGGSLAGYNARLLGPAKIGIAEKPRTFFNTVCDRKG